MPTFIQRLGSRQRQALLRCGDGEEDDKAARNAAGLLVRELTLNGRKKATDVDSESHRAPSTRDNQP